MTGAKLGAKVGANLGAKIGAKARGKTTQVDRRSIGISVHWPRYKPGVNEHKSNNVSNPNGSDED